MPTTRRACLVWAGMGLLCAGIHLYYTCRWSVLCWWDTRCAAPCKTRPGGGAGTDSSVLRCGAGGVGFAGGVRRQLCGLLQRVPQRCGLPRPVCAVAGARLGAKRLHGRRNIALGRGAGGVWHSLQRPQGGKFCRPPRLAHCGLVVLVLDLDRRGRKRHHGERKNAVHRAHPAVLDGLLGDVLLLRAAGVVGRYAAGCRWLRVGATFWENGRSPP